MTKKFSTEERRAAADAAKQKADGARAAAEAKPEDADLEKTATDLEATAAELERVANEPSHEQGQDRDGISKRDKRKKRMDILLAEENADREAEGLAPLSLEEFKDREDDDDDEDDEVPADNKPLTARDLQRMGVIKSAESMVSEIKDADVRRAVADELRNISKKLPAEERFRKALAIASSGKNERVASEAQRLSGRSPQRFSSGSSGSRREADDNDDDDGEFKATAQEKRAMERWGLSKADVLKSRKDARTGNFGQGQK